VRKLDQLVVVLLLILETGPRIVDENDDEEAKSPSAISRI